MNFGDQLILVVLAVCGFDDTFWSFLVGCLVVVRRQQEEYENARVWWELFLVLAGEREIPDGVGIKVESLY